MNVGVVLLTLLYSSEAAEECSAEYKITEHVAYREDTIDQRTPSNQTSCCAWCSQTPKCKSWTYHTGSASKPKSVCTLSSATSGPTEADGAVSGVLDAPPSPPPPSPPAMCPAELAHNSMVAMPYAQQYLGSEGVNMSNFFVATPICCHSRSTLLSGRWNHNNRGPAGYTGCMNMNVSRTDNPQWWEDTFVSRLRRDHGYAVGMFGKVLNVMDSYGCSPGFRTPNVDRFLIMCNHNFFNETWADDRDAATPGPAFNNTAINKTGYAPQDYTTTVSSVNTVNTTIRGATTPMPMQTFISHSPDASLEKIHAGVFCNLHGSWF
eukprot:gene27922-10640_t